METSKIKTNEQVEITEYGYIVVDSFPHVEIIDGVLLVGDKEVVGYDVVLLQCKIPVHLVCRENDGRFICGFDLLPKEEEFWLGIGSNTTSKDPRVLFQMVEEKYPGFYLCPEDEMQL